MIDVGAFQDDDGSLYLYLKATRKGSIYGIKMLDWKTPDYNTLTCLLHKGYTEVVSGTGKAAITEDIQCSGQAGFEFIEGPHMIKYNGEYFLTVSSGDYLAQDYSVQQAKSMSPLGSFRYRIFNEYGYGGENNLWLTSDVNVPAGNGSTWISLRNI